LHDINSQWRSTRNGILKLNRIVIGRELISHLGKKLSVIIRKEELTFYPSVQAERLGDPMIEQILCIYSKLELALNN